MATTMGAKIMTTIKPKAQATNPLAMAPWVHLQGHPQVKGNMLVWVEACTFASYLWANPIVTKLDPMDMAPLVKMLQKGWCFIIGLTILWFQGPTHLLCLVPLVRFQNFAKSYNCALFCSFDMVNDIRCYFWAEIQIPLEKCSKIGPSHVCTWLHPFGGNDASKQNASDYVLFGALSLWGVLHGVQSTHIPCNKHDAML